MARPKKSDSLVKKIDLRLTEEMYIAWKNEADSLDVSMSDWIRARVEGGHVKQKRVERIEVVADPEVRRHLAMMGSNLNQLARAVNMSDLETSDVRQLLSFLSANEMGLAKIREALLADASSRGWGNAT